MRKEKLPSGITITSESSYELLPTLVGTGCPDSSGRNKDNPVSADYIAYNINYKPS
ncbi:MAG: hypothetical protein PF486_08835 [Prolixibacteraceae bacterium]|nr:hypothetical protein [Prolixibacteraceae bacterium]